MYAFLFWSILTSVAFFVGSQSVAHAQSQRTGSGVVISDRGDILTNFHVIKSCSSVTAQIGVEVEPAVIVATDQGNDLATIRVKSPRPAVATFREGRPVRAGDPVVAIGYPLAGLLASTTNLSTGIVSALAGIGDDSRYLQISTPVQPGNSGGPLLDASGHLVGIVTAKLNAIRTLNITGDIPQNVNFAIKAEVAKAFLDSRGLSYRSARSDQQLTPSDIGEIARSFTVQIKCDDAGVHREVSAPASLPTRANRSEEQVASFVAGLFAAWSSSNPAALHALQDAYADQVMYYGKVMSAHDVLHDKQKFVERWPDRDYKIVPGTLSVNCDHSINRCLVVGLTQFTASNRGKKSSGLARFSYSISLGDGLVIELENGSVIKRSR